MKVGVQRGCLIVIRTQGI
uniref:Uncharacterized protein n=1 Tax=Salix viminalis TaxID=40686 RepID=A0A6N2LLR3_SALVM